MFILISPIIRAKHHTAVHHDCLHAMPRFHVAFAKMAILRLRITNKKQEASQPQTGERIHRTWFVYLIKFLGRGFIDS